MIRSLLKRLNRVFNKEPGNQAIATLTPAAQITLSIAKQKISITTATAATIIDISSITVAEAITAMNAISGISATLLDSSYAGKLARGILDINSQTVSGSTSLYYPTNMTWLEMQTYAWALEEQNSNADQAEQCAYMHSATGVWADTWFRDHCGVYRDDGESDSDYLLRAIKEITAIKANNLSMSKLVKDALGVDVNFLDAMSHLDEMDASQQSLAPCRFLLDMSIPNDLSSTEATALIAKIKTVAATYRAGGTYFMDAPLRKSIAPNESISISETILVTTNAAVSDTLIPGMIYVGAGHVVGAPNLKVGINGPMLEQVVVRKLNASDNTVAALSVYGG
ncbi:hypothetical protein [Oryzomonas rubra]|uniref:Uncharacterized protein n=1 Tax=Oryzomonas rubra TaxID=2509454 RepID=A0A5A9X732_9BACT|nr:hypothetical protein [Oryzomonas rubra]KAA0888780.1 hypothetical protein ET418_15480 [Oryzomonas rubra]